MTRIQSTRKVPKKALYQIFEQGPWITSRLMSSREGGRIALKGFRGGSTMLTKTLTMIFGSLISLQTYAASLMTGICFESTNTQSKSQLDAQFDVVISSQSKLMGTLTFSPKTLLEEQVNFVFPAIEKSQGLPLHDYGLNKAMADGSELEIQVTYRPEKMKLFLIHSDKTSLLPQIYRFWNATFRKLKKNNPSALAPKNSHIPILRHLK